MWENTVLMDDNSSIGAISTLIYTDLDKHKHKLDVIKGLC